MPGADKREGINHGKVDDTHGDTEEALRGTGKPEAGTSPGYIVNDLCKVRRVKVAPEEVEAEPTMLGGGTRELPATDAELADILAQTASREKAAGVWPEELLETPTPLPATSTDLP